MSEDSRNQEGSGSGQPRRATTNTLPGILQYVAGVDPEAAMTSAPLPIDSDRRQFLSDALQSLTTDHVHRLQQLMDTLAKPDDDDDQNSVEEKEDALEELIDWCDDIDFGSDFLKMGGVDFLSRFIVSEQSGLRWRILDLMATILQNNDWAQNEARTKGWLGVFVAALEKDSVNLVRIKALYAISCAVRSHDANRKEFLEKHDGFSVLLRASQSEIEKLQIKSIFLMTSIVTSEPPTCDILWRMGIVEQLVGLAFHNVDGISDSNAANFLTEHVFSALCFFASTSAKCLEECRRSDLPLRRTLKLRLDKIKDDETFEDERNYAGKLLKLIDGPMGEDENINCDTER